MRRIQLISLKKSLERAKGFEPSTPTLARLCSILRKCVGGYWRKFDRPLDLHTSRRAGITERKLNILLPFCYPTRRQRTTQADLRWTGFAKICKEYSILQNRPIRADMPAPAFRVRCVRPLCCFPGGSRRTARRRSKPCDHLDRSGKRAMELALVAATSSVTRTAVIIAPRCHRGTSQDQLRGP
jgi:hypothetical protein